MSIKSTLAITIGKTARTILKLLNRNGGSYPGQLTLKIDPNALYTLAKDYEIIIITGTNGKTLTTALTVQALKQKYPNILTNASGSNMSQGIASAFLAHKVKANEKKIAVLEIDEAYIKVMVEALHPKYIVTTNIFRDQMDRFGEIYTIYQKILDGILQSPNTTIIANGDAPIFNSVNLPNRQIYFGFDNQPDGDFKPHYNTDGIICPNCEKIIKYKSIVYANLGKYYCPNCQFKRPKLTYKVTDLFDLSLQESKFSINNSPFSLPVAGLYNIYNALAAYSVAKELGISTAQIQHAFATMNRVFGRQEIISVNDKDVLINLIKNPVGVNQVLELLTLQKKDCTLIIALNDNYADGQDVSWIWDGNFEQLSQLSIKSLATGGKRHSEMTLRLQVAGFDQQDITILPTITEIVEFIKVAPTKHVYVLTTYTAMLAIRKELANQGYVKGELD